MQPEKMADAEADHPILQCFKCLLIYEITILDQPYSLMSAENSNWYDQKQSAVVGLLGKLHLVGGVNATAMDEGAWLSQNRTSIEKTAPATTGTKALGSELLSVSRVPLFRIHTYKLYSQGVTNGG
jgi:hypothetical protein